MEDHPLLHHFDVSTSNISPQAIIQPTRQKKTLNLAERIAVIRQHEKTPNARLLARMFDCGRTQIQNILRNKDQYLDDWNNRSDPHRLRRRFSAPLMALNMVVYEWLKRSQSYDMTVDDEQLKAIGQEAANILQFERFRSNNRWLERFKIKYRIRNLEILGYEKGSNLSLDVNDIIADIEIQFGQKLLQPDNPNAVQHIAALKKFENKWVQYAKDQIMISSSISTPIDLEYKQDQLSSAANTNDSLTFSDGWMGMGTNTTNSDEDDDCMSIRSAISPDGGGGSYSNNTFGEVGNFTYESLNQHKTNDFIGKPMARNEIRTYKEALNHLGPLERFALFSENIRAVGLINQLENLFRDEMFNTSGAGKFE